MPIKAKVKKEPFIMNLYLYVMIVILIASILCVLVIGRTEDVRLNSLYHNGAIAAEHTDCSRIGKNIMIKGGSAVDAAIAASICVGALNNFSSGIGGGGFMLIHEKGKKSTFIDYRESAPGLATKELYGSSTDLTVVGALAIAVPGQLRGYEMAHSKYGRIPWKELFSETIEFCENGFPMTEKQVQMILRVKDDMKKSPTLYKTYFDGKGNPKKVGETIYRPDLAKTLRRIAKDDGVKEFYEGSIAESMVEYLSKMGGILSLDDLKNYKAIEREPVVVDLFGEYSLITGGAPSSGPILVEILKIAEIISKKYPKVDWNHIFIESLKFSYADRAFLADPDYSISVENAVRSIMSERKISIKAGKFDPESTKSSSFYEEELFMIPENHGTSHISVLDSDGLSVSATESLNLEFGSRIMEFGILFNNEMADFSLPQVDNPFNLASNKINYIAPGKRPMSSSSPAIILDKHSGEVVMVVGAAGGSRITSCTAQIILDIMLRGREPMSAMKQCRMHHQLIPNQVLAEYQCSTESLQALLDKGHEVRVLPNNLYLTSAHLVMRNSDGVITAISDTRKGGMADGY